jgi:hypothetical protein
MRDLLGLVQSVFLESGALVQEEGIGAARPDISVWIDDFGSRRNPVVVEVKSSLRGSQQAATAATQVAQFAERSGARSCLVLYQHGPPHLQPFEAGAKFTVGFLRVEELIRRLKTERLGDVLRQAVIARGK